MDMHETVSLYGWHLSAEQLPALISHQFIHFHPYHILFNMIFLWTFGAPLEHLVGRRRFLFYYLFGGICAALCHTLIFYIFNPKYAYIPLYGASGAVSAIMGVYLVRCYFSKIKTGISLFGPFYFIPKRFRISPVILVGFYLFTDLYHGISTLQGLVAVAYFAHVGGILAGAVLSLCSRHLQDAHLDMYFQRSQAWIEKGIGLGQAREDLEAILEKLPDDSQALTQMARVEAALGNHVSAKSYYKKSIISLWKEGKRNQAAWHYSEFYRKYRGSFQNGFQLGLCRELIKLEDYDTASRGLEFIIENDPSGLTGKESAIIEQAYITQGRLLADKLGLAGPAIHVFNRFLSRFPSSERREMVSQKIALLQREKELPAAKAEVYAMT